MVNARSGSKSSAFDLLSYFHPFAIQPVYFEWLDLATSFLIWRYIFRISTSWFSFKVMGPRSRSRQQVVVCNSKTICRKLLGLDRNVSYDNT